MRQPDGDANDNKLEWALVIDPLVADRPVMVPKVRDPYFTIRYDRRINSSFTIGCSWSALR